MDVVRRRSLLLTAALLGIALMLGSISSRAPASPNIGWQVAQATAYFDSTIVLARAARPQGTRGDELTLALGYLERLRVGLGSPFRLADEAMNDPRLDDTTQARVAWALVGRLRRGDAYVVDPTVLDGAGPWDADGRGATGAAHVALIEQAVRRASDPRAGELAVRLAYLVESAKGTLAMSTVSVAAQVAALVRDRHLAMADVRDLLTDANETHARALDLLEERRASYTFRVEQPPLAPLSAALQIEAMASVPALVRALDTLDRVAAPLDDEAASARASVIGRYFAARLRVLGEQRPPVAQVAVTMHGRAHDPLVATNDETLTAAEASLAAVPATDSLRRASALALVSGAVAMRSLAQAERWFPGDDGPGAGDLTAEFGLAAVSFARTVPAAWRPYYLRELQSGLRDMQRVFPSLSVTGLHVRFGTDALRDSALAMHDPRSRTLQLSISTSGGTIAHELSHDLDWQAARRLFADGAGYSSDRAIRERRGPLAASLRGLAEARLLRPVNPEAVARPSDRPAELFARGADWFVATALAQQGRTNGFLSAIEDGLLPGYAAGAPTAIGLAGAGSLVSALEQITYVPDSVRTGFESQWADATSVDPALMIRRVLETPISWRAALNAGCWSLEPGCQTLSSLPRAPLPLCVADRSAESRARASLLMLAVDARAHGIALRRARFRLLPSVTRPDWANGMLGLPPWSRADGERVIDGLRSTIIAELATAKADQGAVPVVPAIFRSIDASCSAIAR